MKTKLIIVICFFVTGLLYAQTRTYTPVVVDSVKVWQNGVALPDLPYNSYNTRLIKNMDEFTAQAKPLMTPYGSDPRRQYEATGFFRTQKIDGRWWIIDPDGYPQIARYINNVRTGKSDRNQAAFAEKFGNNNIWIAKVSDVFDDLGFNGFGGWSEQDLVLGNNTQTDYTMAVTLELGMMASFKERVNNVSPIFDPEFPAHCDQRAKALVTRYKDEKNFFGYFTDNELPFRWWSNLESYLGIADSNDPNRIAAETWLAGRGKTKEQIRNADRMDFVEYLVSTYYAITTEAIRKYDPNHMILGSRIVTYAKYVPAILKAHNAYCDICSINNYETWENSDTELKVWEDNLTIPFMVTEFYAKAEDSGLPNLDGGGTWVKTQTDRAYFYQTFCLKLLESKSCVGWHWFKYLDNDPEYPYSSYFDTDANKGIFDNDYNLYEPLGQYMKELNRNVYRLIDYFDRTDNLSENISLEPVADTFVARSATDTIARGNIKRLATSFSNDKNYHYDTFLKFDLVNYKSSLSGYDKVILKIFGGKSGNKTIKVHGVSGSWDESLTGKTYLNNPDLYEDNFINTIGIVSGSDRYYEVDVTNYVKTALENSSTAQITFRLSDSEPATNTLTTEFYSKEASDNRPVLFLQKTGHTDPGLSELKFDGIGYPEFTNYKHHYDVKLPYTTSGIPQVSAATATPGAVISIVQATSLAGTVEDRTATVTVKDDLSNPKEIRKYRFTFDVLPQMDLFLLIGQSNMAGRGQMDGGYYFSANENVFLLNNNNLFEKADNPLNGYSNTRKNYALQGLGLGYSFARKYVEYAGENMNIGLIVNASGGTSIAQWKKGSASNLYKKTMERVREAQKWGTVKAILWHQGESDLSNNTYQTDLKTLVDSLRKDLDDNTLFVAGEVAQWLSAGAGFNQKLSNAVANISNATFVTSVGLSPLIDTSDPHFDAASQIILGKRYAQEVFKAFNPEVNFDFMAVYQFNGGDDVSHSPAGLNFSVFSATGVTKSTTFTYFPTRGWPASSSLNLDRYNSFTIEPLSGYVFSIKELSFDVQNYSTNGPGNWAVRSSIDNYSSNLASGIITTEWINYRITLDDRFTSLNVPVSFRIYGYNAPNINSSWYIDNVTITGLTAFTQGTITNDIFLPAAKVFVHNAYLTINCNLDEYFVYVYDVFGRLVFKSDLIRSPEYKQLLNVTPGVYLVSIFNQSRIKSWKILID